MTTLAVRMPASRRLRSTEQWAAGVYALALLLIFFQSNVIERMASRLLPIAALAILLARPRRELLTRVVPLALVGFVVWAGASWLWSPDRSGSQIVLLTFVSQVIVAWCCGSFLTLSTLHRLTTLVAKALCVLTVLFLLLAYHVATRPAEDGAPGWHGPFSHKNGLGSFLVLAMLCFWFDRRTKPLHRIGWLALGFVLLIGSQSSTALALVLVSAGALIWNHQTGPQAPLWQRIAWLAGLLAVVGSVGLLLATKFSVVTGLLGRGSSLSGRTNIWAVVIERIGDKPLFGWGFGGLWRPESLPSQSMWQEMRFHAYHAPQRLPRSAAPGRRRRSAALPDLRVRGNPPALEAARPPDASVGGARDAHHLPQRGDGVGAVLLGRTALPGRVRGSPRGPIIRTSDHSEPAYAVDH